MKKFFTLCFALLSAATSFAQDFEAKGSIVFVDKDGVEVADGSTITRDLIEVDPDGFTNPDIPLGLFAKKTVDSNRIGGRLNVNVSRLDNGGFQFCFGTSCQVQTKTGRGYTSEALVKDSYLDNDLQTEWVPASESSYGQCDATLTIYAVYNVADEGSLPEWDNVGESSTINVHFINRDPTGINDVASDANATVVARYSADGKQLKAEQKGLNILKLSNGKTVKVVK